MNRHSITFRLVFWYCGLLLLLGVSFAAYTFISFNRFIDEATRRTLENRSSEIWNLASNLLADKTALAAAIETRFQPEGQNRFIRISTARRVLYQSGPPVERTFAPELVPLPTFGTSHRLMRYGSLSIFVRDFSLGNGRRVTVESGRADEFLSVAQESLGISLLVVLPIVLLVAASGGYILIRQALAPVDWMTKAAEALTFNNPQELLPLTPTGDGIERLGRALNRMLTRLNDAYLYAGRFSADAAHELRTPLTILQGELELLARSTNLPSEVQTAIDSALHEATRLAHLVQSLTKLSQIGSIWGKQAHVPVDLRALASETIEHMRLLAEDKGVTVDDVVGPTIMLEGDPERLKQIIVNLLDNAVKYTPRGGRIAVQVSAARGWAIVEVIDNGIGIEAEHLPHIFERFYRASSDRGEAGAGLGLAIVKSICEAHHGRIAVTSSPGAGSRFRVEIPLAIADQLQTPKADAYEETNPTRINHDPAMQSRDRGRARNNLRVLSNE